MYIVTMHIIRTLWNHMTVTIQIYKHVHVYMIIRTFRLSCKHTMYFLIWKQKQL